MNRPSLKLIETIPNALDFVMGKGEQAGVKEISTQEQVDSYLQLFFTWPSYSACFLKVGTETVKATLSIDAALSEIDQMFITISEYDYELFHKNGNKIQKIFIETFGITFAFEPNIIEFIDQFSAEMPSISISIPSTIWRYNLRGTRRIRPVNKIEIKIIKEKNIIKATIIDISPNAFSVRLDEKNEGLNLNDRSTFSCLDFIFDGIISSFLNNSIIVKPITNEANQFGQFFDFYLKCAYPSLQSRFSFNKDPIPELLTKTGQIKNYGASEVSDTWYSEIEEAYEASKLAKDQYVASYVSLNDKKEPVGTSSLARVFMDSNGIDTWAFHGLGAVKDPELISNTCELYKWRVDYLLSKEPKANVVMWFNGRGRWLEKVYTKFYFLTEPLTKLWPIKHNRYISKNYNHSISIKKTSTWKNEKTFSIGKFSRYMASNEEASLGLGIPYLNYGGILNNIYFFKNNHPSTDVVQTILNTINEQSPKRFFIETPLESENLELPNYEIIHVDVANRQCLTTCEALRFFISSLEHSEAVVKRKYGYK